jgi:hypothetical protein
MRAGKAVAGSSERPQDLPSSRPRAERRSERATRLASAAWIAGGSHRRAASCFQERSNDMLNLLWGLALLLIILWVLGFALSFTMGGVIHVLLVLAVVAVLVRIILGRRLA